ncbi:DUF6160 family protein [Alkalimarinus sediminis]|uniref:DUF6160 domain-containing protein n=1 Tax=Alkalimarinus sediminis TaxID=1632866 RepID=A0A9E8HPI0_9ALTE|nr:DUF6160 family protein [Alkalimarinus sediminis]UZW74126.1 hypothetical protein NNL22_13985 [Alkalimarinus sediminis]
MKTKQVLYVVSSLLISSTPLLTYAEMVGLEETELSQVAGQSGLSIEIPHVRINAHNSGSVDNPNTSADESDGRRTKGYKSDYITREHNGGNETHYFVEEVSLAADIEGAITLDIGGDGTLVIGLPDSINFVGDGYSAKGIYLNNTGLTSGGGQMLDEISIQGNFNTGGTISIWGE